MSLASDSSETVEDIKLGTVTASGMRMHRVLIILTLTFIQGHKCVSNLTMKIINVFDYFRQYSSNAHQVCCEDSRTEGLYDHCQSDDLDLYSRSQMLLKLYYFLTCNVSDNI